MTMVALHRERLYQSRVAAIRSEEVARIARVTCVSGVSAALSGPVLGVPLETALVLTGSLVAFVLLVYGRGRFQAWITDQRSIGHFTRSVVVVGGSKEAAALIDLFTDSPELGFVPVGFAGSLDLDAPVPSVPWLGGPGDVLAAVGASGASGVVIAASGVSSVALNRLVRELHEARVHVLLSSGISGMHHRRLRVQPVGCEPLIYVEPASLSRVQVAAKRILDIVGSAILLVASAPVLLVAAVAIKRSDGGPIIFRQERIGRNQQPFAILKLRTMCLGAEEMLPGLQDCNERDGPLFKIADDPRVTKVGRFLRASSIDELPQLVNVLRGEMSLVGPRPALPEEAAAFDLRLIERLQVRPGITGLWQVEARDKPSFDAYRRLDLFYVENWSVWLDTAILLKTGRTVLRRLRRSASWAHHPASTVGRVEVPLTMCLTRELPE